MEYVYTKAITGTASNIDKKINEYLENADYSQVLDIKISEITKIDPPQLIALLILQGS